jgi:hypothetical protein
MTVNLDVSIVIPTLGEKKLIKVVHYLNKNTTFRISEIILSIPRNKYNYVKSITKNIDNIKLVCNGKKGQVLQRINGFKAAKENNVLQLDDDTFISCEDINLLRKKIFGINQKKSVAPIFKTFSSEYLHKRKNNFLHNIHFYILTLIFGSTKKINNFGTFDNSLISFKGNGTYRNLSDSTRVDWTLGACLLHKKKNLILKNYYPFLGKSFFEDVLHSLEMKSKGINLYLIKNASAYCKREESIKDFNDLINYLRAVKFFTYKTQMGFYDKFRKIYAFFIYRLVRLIIKN